MKTLEKEVFVNDLTEEELAQVGRRCTKCGAIQSRQPMMDLREPKGKKTSYQLWCLCLHPGDTILGGSIF